MGVLHGHELFLEDNDDLDKCLISIYLLKSALTELATESQLKRCQEWRILFGRIWRNDIGVMNNLV
jgi:hypothetical protein